MLISDRQTLPVLGAVVVCTLPHFFNVSIWVVASCLILWGYTLAAIKYSWRLPGRLPLTLLATCLFVAAMATHEGFTIEAFAAVLALMVSLKLLEAKTTRDRIITVILCYFLIVADLFFGDSIGATVYMIISILLVTAVLVYINHPEKSFATPLKVSGRLMIEALPIAVILFLLFPRVQGGLWGRAPVKTARTGFSDTMTFDNIAELAHNTAVAFRVEFADSIPPRDQLYWRGIVLWEFDGKNWVRGGRRRGDFLNYTKPSQPVQYTITLEPHNEHWLFTLDLPIRINFHHAWLNSDHTCYRWWPITQRINYTGISDLGTSNAKDDQRIKDALQLPPSGNPRSRELARSLQAQAGSTLEFIEKVLQYFRDNNYTYTLNPPPLSVNTNGQNDRAGPALVDRFLFETRKGFCEHFASSFAFLMRAAGIPSRIVAGYQGGSLNQYGKYLIVRQSDAHAWCEVWIPEQGWKRVDPTGMVAPERLTEETVNALSSEETGRLYSLLRSGRFGKWFGSTINMWDYVNSRWNRWVMDYSPYEDIDFFVKLNINPESSKGWGLAVFITLAGMTVTAAFVYMFIQLRSKTHQDEVADVWNIFCRKMNKTGLPRRPEQGPVDYMHFIILRRPELNKQVRDITSAYIQVRYRRNHEPADLERLQWLIKHFSPPGQSRRGRQTT